MTAAGSKAAFYGAVYNAIAGVGWTDMAGTTGKTVIPINTEGQFLDSYKKVQLPEIKEPLPEIKEPLPEVKEPLPEIKAPLPEIKETKPAKKVTSVTVNVKTVNAKAVKNAVKKAGGKDANITTITLGSKVAKINASTFKGFKKAKTLVVKTKKLKKATVKNSLKGSKVTKIKVNVGSKSSNKKFVKNYKKIFTKKNAGKAVKVA